MSLASIDDLQWLRRAAAVASPLPRAERLPVLSDGSTALLVLGEEEGWTAAARFLTRRPASRMTSQVTVVQLNLGDLAMMLGALRRGRTAVDRAMEFARLVAIGRYREVSW